MEKVSVKQAINKGQLLVNLPISFIMFGFMILGVIVIPKSTILGIILCVIGFPLGWLYWSVSIVKWKLWAYKNVDDVTELKKAAVKAYLTWPDDSQFNKTEINRNGDSHHLNCKFVL